MNSERIVKILQAPPDVQKAIDKVLDGKPHECAFHKPTEPLLLGMGAAAKYLGVSRATLWRMIRAGVLEKVEYLSGSYRIRRADLDAIAAGQVEAGK